MLSPIKMASLSSSLSASSSPPSSSLCLSPPSHINGPSWLSYSTLSARAALDPMTPSSSSASPGKHSLVSFGSSKVGSPCNGSMGLLYDVSMSKVVAGDYGYVLEDVPQFSDYISNLPVSLSPSLVSHISVLWMFRFPEAGYKINLGMT